MNALRTGYTTGVCMTAAALAAYREYLGERVSEVTVALPNGELTLPVVRLAACRYSVTKDAGDDPDVTHGCEVIVSLTPGGEPAAADYLVGNIILRGGAGVGLVSRGGLAAECGKAAINPAPRRMLAKNLPEVADRVTLTIEVPNGEDIAQKTLNPALGVIGGISILGTSGIVHPFSHKAYTAAIALQLRQNPGNCVLTTGTRTAAAAQRDYPGTAVIIIGDFIGDALKLARNHNVTVACMPGKLLKYACGELNTHAASAKQSLSNLSRLGIGVPGGVPAGVSTMRGLGEHLGSEEFKRLLEHLASRAGEELTVIHGKALALAVYDDQGERLL